jgi:hypothetical protein
VSLAETPLTSGANNGWILRSAAACAVAASFVRVLVVPALGASQFDLGIERASAALAYLAYLLLAAALLVGSFVVSRSVRVPLDARMLVAPAAGVVVALGFAAMRDRLMASWEIVLAVAAIVATLRGALGALLSLVTRAAAGVLVLLVLAAIVRLAAWKAGIEAGERASTALFAAAQRTDGAALVLEWLAHLAALVWIATRARKWGVVVAAGVLVLSIAITWGGVSALHADASGWQSVLHSAVAQTTGTSEWLALRVLSTFLAVASIGIATAAVALPRQLPAVAAPIALAIVSRGSFDAPLRALAAVTAGVWLLVAATEEEASPESLRPREPRGGS